MLPYLPTPFCEERLQAVGQLLLARIDRPPGAIVRRVREVLALFVGASWRTKIARRKDWAFLRILCPLARLLR